MSAAARLLIIDDDRALCELLSDYLSSAGFEVDSTHTGALAARMFMTRSSGRPRG